jgi:hypothetical protein
MKIASWQCTIEKFNRKKVQAQSLPCDQSENASIAAGVVKKAVSQIVQEQVRVWRSGCSERSLGENEKEAQNENAWNQRVGRVDS